jgi:hypothetical protein
MRTPHGNLHGGMAPATPDLNPISYPNGQHAVYKKSTTPFRIGVLNLAYAHPTTNNRRRSALDADITAPLGYSGTK